MSPAHLNETFAALADPTRRAILERLAEGPATVGELARPFEMSLPTVSRHLKVLTHAGLIRRETQAQWRHCHMEPGPLEDAANWIARNRAFWDSRFDALSHYLEKTKQRENDHDRDDSSGES